MTPRFQLFGSRRLAALLLVLLSSLWSAREDAAAGFLRGDANGDGMLNIGDPQFTLNFLFLGGRAPDCPAAADANDDERLDISDALAALGFLFLGDGPLPPPGPTPGPDPTPGLGCGLDPPEALLCRARGSAVLLEWAVGSPYDGIEILRDGEVIATLEGTATSHVDRPFFGGRHDYGVRGLSGRETTDTAVCTILNLPTNAPPSLQILSPAPGAVVDSPSVEITGRVNDDFSVVRIVAGGVDVTPSGPPVVPYNFTAVLPLRPGPNLIRIEAVDDFGRTAFKELALGRPNLLLAGGYGQSLALDVSGTTGYSELEDILRPFLNEIPALLNNAIAGVVLIDTRVAGIPIRVTGDRVEVPGAISIDFFPSAEQGGRLGLRANFERIKIFARGRSDFGFLGTDNWDAEFEARNVAITGLLALSPVAGGTQLDLATDGFVVTIGSSSVVIRDFLDPLGIFDGVVNLLASAFNSQIQDLVRDAVQQAANEQILPILADAFSGLKLNLDLGDLRLDTRFDDVIESINGLSVLFGGSWRNDARDPAFPPYPGSLAGRAPYPSFPLGVTVPHAIDATISLSVDTLNQALFELTATGLLKTTVELSSLEAPIPLQVGTLASILDQRLLSLPGVAADNPLGLRVEAEFPAQVRLGTGVLGNAIVGEGALWRLFRGRAEPPADWRTTTFSDASWETGASGFGYSNDAEERRGVRTELDDMMGVYSSLYSRVAFELVNPGTLTGLVLHVIHDDGFVAFLNGTEIARVNMGGVAGELVPFDALATAAIDRTETSIDLIARRNLLRTGKNVLAIQGHNATLASTDFILTASLLEPLPLPVGALGAVPAAIDLQDLVLTFVADTDADGMGDTDLDGRADEVDLFALKLAFSIQARLLLIRREGEAPEIAFEILNTDGPDADNFPDAIVGGAQGIEIGVARESIDMRSVDLIDFGQLLLALFAPSLGDLLTDFELPSFPLPELAFDLNGDGANDVRLDVVNATFAPVDSTGDRQVDWLCILANLRDVAP